MLERRRRDEGERRGLAAGAGHMAHNRRRNRAQSRDSCSCPQFGHQCPLGPGATRRPRARILAHLLAGACGRTRGRRCPRITAHRMRTLDTVWGGPQAVHQHGISRARAELLQRMNLAHAACASLVGSDAARVGLGSAQEQSSLARTAACLHRLCTAGGEDDARISGSWQGAVRAGRGCSGSRVWIERRIARSRGRTLSDSL